MPSPILTRRGTTRDLRGGSQRDAVCWTCDGRSDEHTASDEPQRESGETTGIKQVGAWFLPPSLTLRVGKTISNYKLSHALMLSGMMVIETKFLSSRMISSGEAWG